MVTMVRNTKKGIVRNGKEEQDWVEMARKGKGIVGLAIQGQGTKQ